MVTLTENIPIQGKKKTIENCQAIV